MTTPDAERAERDEIRALRPDVERAERDEIRALRPDVERAERDETPQPALDNGSPRFVSVAGAPSLNVREGDAERDEIRTLRPDVERAERDETTRPDVDPWVLEAKRAAGAPGFRRPDIGPVPRARLVALGALAALRALGLVLIADAIARGIAALAAGGLDTAAARAILIAGVLGALLRAGAEWATAVTARRVASEVKRDLRSRLWRRIAGGDASGGGTAVLAADGLDDLDDYYVQSIPALIAAAVVPLVVGLRILGADWISAGVVVLTVPLVPLFMILIGKHTQQRTDAALSALTRLADHLAELARGLPVLVGLGRVEEQTDALDGIQRAYRTRTQETLRWAFLSALALELIATISVALVAVLLGIRLLNGTVELAPAILALVLAPECYAALREVGTAFHASQDGLAALDRAKALLARPASRDVRDGGASAAVRIENLAVRYAGREHDAFAPVTTDLSGIVSVVGRSGAGKSTLLAALTGTLPADAAVTGRIVGLGADGVGWAPQAPRGFAGTPAEELALYGAADPLGALNELGLAHVAAASIAELSPGEVRRLAVARALARVDAGARLLVLDEPTAHLDRTSADRVRAAIRRRAERATVVLASHEPETLALATLTLALTPVAPAAVSHSARPSAPDTRSDRDMGTPAPAPMSHSARLSERHTRSNRDTADQARGLSLLSLLRPELPAWAGAVGLGVVATGLGLALTAVSGWLIVRANVEEYIMYLLVAIVGVRAFGIGRSVGRYAERLVTHRAAFRTVDGLRLRLWRAIAARGAGSRRLLEGGAPLDYLVTLADDLRDQLPRVVAPLAIGVLAALGAVVTTWFVVPHLTVPVLVVLTAALALAAWLSSVAERGAGRARVAARSEIVRGTAALAAASADLRGNGMAPAALDALDAAAARLADAERRASWAGGLGTAVVTAATAILAVVVAPLSPGVPAESASVIALLALALLDPLAGFVAAAQRVPALREVIGRLAPVLRPAPTAAWGEQQPEGPVHAVDLDAVAVQYPGADHPAVSDVSGTAAAGRWLVVAGPSGSGKSTLLSAIMGALPVARGAIRADGAALTSLDERAWRGRVAWCPQDAYVFDSTLRGNLLLARGHDEALDDATLQDALIRVGLGPLLASLSDGLSTRVGAAGSALSGGERQRLAVARALLARADVILLDEPTAHLDAPTAATMMADVRAATEDRVVVLVSHRDEDRRPDDALVHL
ncbi:thiol reductant ABC exporter subunit CydC [Microbacterium oryzae]|uniref:thiol reductant ABC exporter subunit CydC n=1 Tax=Microbacterium oryzae TaxID=743009 RepID=UPI0025AEE2FC|nr:thiol reductant ABC exporter subunit CydC [Microbacterium oryzae]MDN3310929.1 thiol reductant ABC exporter subunit CydC [Microbacterium oryzae]